MKNCPQSSASGRGSHRFTRFRWLLFFAVAVLRRLRLASGTGATLPPGYPLASVAVSADALLPWQARRPPQGRSNREVG